MSALPDASAPSDIDLSRPPDAAKRRSGSLALLASVLVTGTVIGWLAAAQWGPMQGSSADAQATIIADADLAPAALPEVPSARLPVLMQRDGMYLVGNDVQAGRYVATGTGSICFYATVTDLSGSLNAVVTTHFGDAYGRRVELNEGEYFETDACGTWLLEEPR